MQLTVLVPTTNANTKHAPRDILNAPGGNFSARDIDVVIQEFVQ